MTSQSRKNNLYSSISLPSGPGVSPGEVWQWYRNIPGELELDIFTRQERDYLREYYEEVGLLRSWRQPFFHQHFSESFAAAARFLLAGRASPTLLDLGCGCGTQSLFLAIKGAKAIGLDMDPTALSLAEKRRRFYEERLGRSLDLTFHCSNVFHFDFGPVGPIDGLHSLFAFNLMQPNGQLLGLISHHFRPRARVAILDGNNLSWLPRLFPSRRRKVCSPPELRKEFESLGFAVRDHRGGIVFPPFTWRLFSLPWLSRLDRALGRNWFFPVSHRMMAEKQ